MDVIPVIDLKGGLVVRARLGQREHYSPIETPLSPTACPIDVARGILSVFPFHTLYVADLNAITREGDNAASLAKLRRAYPALTLWVDSGIADPDAAARWLAADLGHLVVGSESLADLALVRRLGGHERVVLSLDFDAHGFRGPPALLKDASIWPRRLVAMTLGRVGSGAGPDLDTLGMVRGAAGDRLIYAAGGVRDATDLAALARAGIAGALVATSLHDGRLGRADIERLSHRNDGEPPSGRDVGPGYAHHGR